MISIPLAYIKKYREEYLIEILKKEQLKGIKVVVYSDFPVTEKIDAIGLVPDELFSADEVGCLKPNECGIKTALKMKKKI